MCSVCVCVCVCARECVRPRACMCVRLSVCSCDCVHGSACERVCVTVCVCVCEHICSCMHVYDGEKVTFHRTARGRKPKLLSAWAAMTPDSSPVAAREAVYLHGKRKKLLRWSTWQITGHSSDMLKGRKQAVKWNVFTLKSLTPN